MVHLFVVYGFLPEVHLEKLALTSQLLEGVLFVAKVVASGQLEVIMGDPDVPPELVACPDKAFSIGGGRSLGGHL